MGLPCPSRQHAALLLFLFLYAFVWLAVTDPVDTILVPGRSGVEFARCVQIFQAETCLPVQAHLRNERTTPSKPFLRQVVSPLLLIDGKFVFGSPV